jgi:hypothetical protein
MIAAQKQAATATSHRAFTASPVTVRRAQAVRMRASEPQSAAGPNTTTTAEGIIPRTTQDASGYVEFDTAGQSNMYPVITKPYETGSGQDTLETGGANFAVGVGAGAIAVAVLAIGLTALTQQGADTGAAMEQFKSLSEYAAAFSADL